MFPQEKHSVPSTAQARPGRLACRPARSSGQNSATRPARPKRLPASTWGASLRPWMMRASSAFQRLALENTTAARPLASVSLACMKHTKLKLNRHRPWASTRGSAGPRGTRSCRDQASQANISTAASAKR